MKVQTPFALEDTFAVRQFNFKVTSLFLEAKLLYSVLAAFDKFRISACKKLLPVMASRVLMACILVYLSYLFSGTAFCSLKSVLSGLASSSGKLLYLQARVFEKYFGINSSNTAMAVPIMDDNRFGLFAVR